MNGKHAEHMHTCTLSSDFLTLLSDFKRTDTMPVFFIPHKRLVSTTNLSKLVKYRFQCASNRVTQPTNITNSVVLLATVATPINYAYCAYAYA